LLGIPRLFLVGHPQCDMKDEGPIARLRPSLDQRATQIVATPTNPSAGVKAQLKKTWNTTNLGLRVAADFVSAACAASLVAPLISVIDRYAGL
jgi:hypothetical protein